MSAYVVNTTTLQTVVSWSVKHNLLEHMGVSSPDELGQLLHEENVRSVNNKYGTDTVPGTYAHTQLSDVELTPEKVRSEIRTFDYNSSDTSDWSRSPAYECLAHMECELVRHSAHYAPTLHEARHVIVVDALLEARADPNGVRMSRGDTDKDRPLHCARTPEIAEALIQGGANVNAINAKGETPLHSAAMVRSPETVQVLLDAGADPHAVDKKGNTPLHFTTFGGNVAAAQVLVNAGADPLAANNDGVSPLEMADIMRNPQIKSVIEHALLANSSWSPSSADAEALIPAQAANADYETPTQQRSRRL